eukprot:COSAG05_NODE_4699_length_1406_cov_1.070390_1_plen_163_part_10
MERRRSVRVGQPLRRVRLGPSAARLRLETLSTRQLRWVLAVSWAAVAAATLLAVFERTPFGYESQSSAGRACEPPAAGGRLSRGWGGAPAAAGATTCVSPNRSWHESPAVHYTNASRALLTIELNHTNRFFKCEAVLTARGDGGGSLHAKAEEARVLASQFAM